MPLHALISAMHDYLAAVEAGEHWRYGPGETKGLREELDRTRRLLAEEIGAARQANPSAGRPPARAPAFRNILVAVDASPPSAWAAATAARLAAAGPDVRVTLLHVIDTTKGFSPEFSFAEGERLGQLRAGAEDLLRRHASTSFSTANGRPDRLIRMGSPADEIVRAAWDYSADLVVLGTHSHGRVATFLLGSTAEAVVRRARCAVLTVGRDPAEPPSAGRAKRETAEYQTGVGPPVTADAG